MTPQQKLVCRILIPYFYWNPGAHIEIYWFQSKSVDLICWKSWPWDLLGFSKWIFEFDLIIVSLNDLGFRFWVTVPTVSSWVGNMELDDDEMFAPSTIACSDAGMESPTGEKKALFRVTWHQIPSPFEILEIFMLVAGSKLKVLDPYQIRFHTLSGL